jgi:hypothetical protein
MTWAFQVQLSEEPFWGTAGAQQDRNDGVDQRKSLSLVFKINVLNQELVCRFVQTIVSFVVLPKLTHNLKVVSSNLAPATKIKPAVSMRWRVFFCAIGLKELSWVTVGKEITGYPQNSPSIDLIS